MHIRQYLSSSPRQTRPWRLALVSVLLIGLFLPQPALAASTWANTAPMSIARDAHTATLLPSGKVLMVGGFDGGGGGYFTSAEVYDPGVDTWTTVASLPAARAYHTATLLPNGKVLIVGGLSNDVLAGAEVYDSSADTWTAVAP